MIPKSTAASSGHAELPPPAAPGQPLPVPMGPPAKAGPATGFLSAASAASSDPVGAHSAPGSSIPGAGNPGKGWSGPVPGKRGPNLGGVFLPASVAPTVITSFNPPVGGEGQSNCMRKCRKKDRDLQHFPKGAFELLPPRDPPILDTIAGADGPGWYPDLWNLRAMVRDSLSSRNRPPGIRLRTHGVSP